MVALVSVDADDQVTVVIVAAEAISVVVVVVQTALKIPAPAEAVTPDDPVASSVHTPPPELASDVMVGVVRLMLSHTVARTSTVPAGMVELAVTACVAPVADVCAVPRLPRYAT